MNSNDIRQSFVDYFVERGHLHQPSAPLVPHGDATLMFTNAGMVPFKNYFLAVETPPGPRAVTSQKCLRVSGKHNDLENVGPSPRHHTFFEMLGNFSFGDYFKEEAIEFGWDLVTRVWALPKEHLFATVFREDDDAYDLWAKISGLPPERIARCGEKDNFWAMGDTGPCGPCSEIFIDRFPELKKVPFEEGEANGRYLEIWNLVFMQYERSEGGVLEPLPKPSIDTGSGLERVAAAMQGHDSNYGTDLFLPLLNAAAELAGTRYTGSFDQSPEGVRDTSLRVIADHLRASAFLLADGVLPASDGRGYVLRRILRRGIRHGMRLGLEEPFFGKLLPELTSLMGDAYPELSKAEPSSLATYVREERSFFNTIAIGAQKVQEAIEQAKTSGSGILAGPVVFRLYDTYGLPIDTVREIAEEEQFAIDEDGFSSALEEQRTRSRTAAGGGKGLSAEVRAVLVGSAEPTDFKGYEQLSLEGAEVIGLARLEAGEDDSSLGEIVTSLSAGEKGLAVLDRTVFYAESGGQVGDAGEIRTGDTVVRVTDVTKDAGVFLHAIDLVEGSLEVGARVNVNVDVDRRRRTERHHTATHLLHAALRSRVGEGVRQAGSLVEPERLRFDFTHDAPLTPTERRDVEETVNTWIRQADPVVVTSRPYAEAVADGAMALFGEKYGDVVRTVDVPHVSLELCGGCHVANTGQIGGVAVVAERGVASGVRRIEALAGAAAESHRASREAELHSVENELGVAAGQSLSEVLALKERLRDTEKELKSTRMKLMSGSNSNGDAAGAGEEEVAGVKVLVREVDAAPMGELRSLADVLRQRLGSGVVVLATRADGKVTLLAAVTEDLAGKVHAGQLARSAGEAVGGKGGGRADFAQAGGKDPGSLDGAFSAVRSAVAEQLSAAGSP